MFNIDPLFTWFIAIGIGTIIILFGFWIDQRRERETVQRSAREERRKLREMIKNSLRSIKYFDGFDISFTGASVNTNYGSKIALRFRSPYERSEYAFEILTCGVRDGNGNDIPLKKRRESDGYVFPQRYTIRGNKIIEYNLPKLNPYSIHFVHVALRANGEIVNIDTEITSHDWEVMP